MNKKVSTILTCGLILGGSLLSSSAFAQATETLPIGDRVSSANKFVDGGRYFIVQDGYNDNNEANDIALGFLYEDATTQEKLKVTLAKRADHVAKADWNKYIWVARLVSSDGGKYSYSFENEYTHQLLRVNYNNGAFDAVELSTKSDDWVNDATSFSFSTNMKDYTNGPSSTWRLFVQSTLLDTDATNDKALSFAENSANIIWGTSDANFVNLYSVKDNEVADPSGLNNLYNLAGFNFEIEEGVTNIFADGKVKAIKVEDGDVEWGKQVSGEYPYSFPAGTYFAVKTPSGDYSTMSATEKKNYLLGCTFIAVSPASNVADDADEQAAGRGFTLTTVSGQDLNCYTEQRAGVVDTNEQTSGNDISVFNACFEGWENAGVPGKYALALKNVRYQAKSTETKHEQKSLALNVIAVHYGSMKYLATSDYATNNFVFTLAKTSAIDPVEAKILNESGASIYNIQFVSNDANDHKSEYGKYLTIATNSINTYWAKGIALADLNTPAFEFVISKVVDKNITFTNRETGVSFTTMLYPETAEGEGVYSIALDVDKTLEVADVADNGNVVKGNQTTMNKTYINVSSI